MKKILPRSICVVVLLIILAVTVGCGENKEAKSTMQKADDFISGINTTFNELSEDLESFVKTFEEGTNITITLLQQAYDTIEAQADMMADQIKSARSEVQNILDMEGVAGYKKYADVQEEILDNSVALTKSLGDMLNELSSASRALESGNAPDASKLAESAAEWARQYDELLKKSKDLQKKALEIKEEEGL